MIADKRLPVMVAVMVIEKPGPRASVEYDTRLGQIRQYVEAEVFPKVAEKFNVTFTKDPNARPVMGGSSSSAGASRWPGSTRNYGAACWFSPARFVRLGQVNDIAPNGELGLSRDADP